MLPLLRILCVPLSSALVLVTFAFLAFSVFRFNLISFRSSCTLDGAALGALCLISPHQPNEAVSV